MLPSRPNRIGIALASSPVTVTVGTAPSSIPPHHGAYAIPSAISPGLSDRFGDTLAWTQPGGVTSFGEAVLIAVLFVLIGAIVVLRAREALSKRHGADSFPPLVADEADETIPARTDGPTTAEVGRRPFERFPSPEMAPDLLSDEGKVVQLLVANRGRIRQHRIAEETGWSKSKVSRTCSQMAVDGTIEKTSVGRENVIVLSDTEPDERDASTQPSDTGYRLP